MSRLGVWAVAACDMHAPPSPSPPQLARAHRHSSSTAKMRAVGWLGSIAHFARVMMGGSPEAKLQADADASHGGGQE